MTGRQLRYYRESNQLSQKQLALRLGDISAATLGRWELDFDADVPAWVAERLFRRMPVTIALEDLHTILDEARERHTTPENIINELLKDYARRRLTAEPDHRSLEAEPPGAELAAAKAGPKNGRK